MFSQTVLCVGGEEESNSEKFRNDRLQNVHY